MLAFLPAPLLGVISSLLITLNTAFWFTLFLPAIFLKLCLPVHSVRHACSLLLIRLAENWVACNSQILKLCSDFSWHVEGLEQLDPKASYLVISNHRSWTDIFALQHLCRGKIPFLKFFLKQELIWVPLLGIAWWALDFPFMKRYSAAYLAKHPEMKGKDMETTRKYCEKFKHYPVSVINFLEGSRFTPSKRLKRKSRYRHLLNPKAGGVALVLSSMGDYLNQVLDVTLVYPPIKSNLFWGLLSGQLTELTVKVRTLPVPENVVGRDYLEDEAYREQIQTWVNGLWEHKDQLIESLQPTSTPEKAANPESAEASPATALPQPPVV